MGKRKERRLAAKTAVNRRVKLDLIAEPSGDFGDSSNKEDVEGGGNSKNPAGSPNSPSSSGQKPENPLLLLGQYSDEESEEESGKEMSHDTRENSPAELDEQVKVESHEGSTEVDKDENLISEKPDEENIDQSSSLDVEENGVIEDVTILPSHKDMDEVEQTAVSWTSDTQTENMDSGWKMVLHEESNSYYYWNIVTGQTSWEVPVDLVQGNEPAYDPQSVTQVDDDTQQPNDGPTKSLVFEATDNDSCRHELEVHNNIMSNDVVEGNYVNSIDGLSNGEAHHTDSFRLLQLGESLSERLKSLKGENEEISKLMIEVDIRLADIKSLVPYGSSLLPFWLHSENHLRKIETAINSEILEHSQLPNVGETNEAENKVQENTNEATASENENAITRADTDDDMDVEMEVEDEAVVRNGPQSEEEFEVDIPPPPTDEWVPPPPPDDEPLPPPPPDEQHEATFPPPQAYSYGGGEGEEYSFAYGFEYYGHQQVVANHDYYVDANGCQVAAAASPIPTLYYAPVANPYPGGTSVVDPTGEHVTYYTIQEGIQPVIASESSVAASDPPPTSTTTVSAPKAQPKVVRNKKRTVATVPGLRSNKKVSGLVDKWKAVKEELHSDDEEDEEPENALQVLEKKKQREIEQWRAQQIATGEAKDNANFQPLGGDWRERVRRKRAKKSMEAEEHEPKGRGSGTDDTNQNQKPDLVQLTKQLPSGWQAYWDEASKQVYYGNSKTSQTSWTKPQPKT